MKAEVIADSISPAGDRLTTMVVEFPRFVLAEYNTHRKFSRNSASSRAIPVSKTLNTVREAPVLPVEWPREQPGMQGGLDLDNVDQSLAENFWLNTHKAVVNEVDRYLETLKSVYPNLTEKTLKEHTLHKSVVNRVLEPWMMHTVIVSSTEWDNFFEQRCSPQAQPEIRVPAEMMRDALNNSTPDGLGRGMFHLPFVDYETYESIHIKYDPGVDLVKYLIAVSVARCARVSYLNHEGVRSIEDDIKLFNRLMSAEPKHFSPGEHVATPASRNFSGEAQSTLGNFDGWEQVRHIPEFHTPL